MSQLICQDLALGYAGKAIVRNLNFRVNAGDYFCIVGENGSGKSTLMRTLLHLQPPVSGSILTGDGLKTNEIGYLPQQTLVQRDFPASVREIVLSGCQGRCGSRPFYTKAEKELAEENMEKLGIKGFSGRCYRELSGGQQQRVLLARALCATRKLLLLDEPVNGLDFQSTEFLYQLMGGYKQYGTLLFSSHILESICLTSDRVLVLEQGRISRTFTGTEIAAGKIREVLADEEHH